MKLFLLIFLGILALNALVILAVAGILGIDHLKARRKHAKKEAKNDAAADVS